ncbi:hypothetical protein [Azotobacter beijerinckii]|uniref:Uncharacterized protein n=1 Tax=Azotobacter beijerinckii TaxID=170623 RepID=A0A1I4IEL3_9GAMM|nr:hypothetical protein [Azotobacter beijerinckii]SFB59497.1 hypothetical protein SAMN04244571_04103 [Azotobacter beijerinckii]SFL52497.1 hypothetical protein SAMN04244574_04570 [Azotobacter beijerinckii]
MAKLAHKNLHPASPSAGLHALARPDLGYTGQPRRLSEAQLKLPFFKKALECLKSIVQTRFKLLPLLMHANGNERITRVEVYKNLAAVAEPILVRLDLATGVLGWLDETGNFRLNNQKGLAHDAGLQPATLNRLFKLLEKTGYLTRRLERIAVREHGTQLVRTRVMIRVTDLFWRHLRLSLAHTLSRKAARKKRLRTLHALELAKAQTVPTRTPARRSNPRGQGGAAAAALNGRLRVRTAPLDDSRMPEQLLRHEILLRLKFEHPSLPAAELNAMADAILSGAG